MMTAAVSQIEAASGLAPFSLKDAPALIERQFPVGRLSAEAYKERDAGQGQTLTALGSFWKGRKPLILVRGVVLGALLPATADAARDLEIFLKLMGMHDDSFASRFDGTALDFARFVPEFADRVTESRGKSRIWREDLDLKTRQRLMVEAFSTLPYSFDARLKSPMRRPEECEESSLLEAVWGDVNAHLGTASHSLAELVSELGVARFGHKPRVSDTFCGGGSIPFEAARIGCDAHASDLNPIACMLTWGAFNIVGSTPEKRLEIDRAQTVMAETVEAQVAELGVEIDREGNRAKAFLYCLETTCPKTGWSVPMAPSWIISRVKRVVARLVPDSANKRYDIELHSNVSDEELVEAAEGTIRSGRLVHPMNADRSGVDLKVIRGDFRDEDGFSRNRIRRWGVGDFIPREDDIYRERLYAIQWITQATFGQGREESFFTAVRQEDVEREQRVIDFIGTNLSRWQSEGVIPDTLIPAGAKTDEPIRTRGWTYWHHLFGPRHLLTATLFRKAVEGLDDPVVRAALLFVFQYVLDRSARLSHWRVGSPGRPGRAPSADAVEHVFYNQAFNTFYNYGARALGSLKFRDSLKLKNVKLHGSADVELKASASTNWPADLFVTDPPYADSVRYEEITEFFSSWLQKRPPSPFDGWDWQSNRAAAITGKDEEFRRSMVKAYTAMTAHMSDNGVQIVMFTHQDAGVWADLGAILWASGLRVTAAWNVVTEIAKPSGDGNYVQGTICLVLRKRATQANARRMDIEAEIEEAVASQIDRLTALDDAWHERANAEVLYTDGDLTLAAYAAALQVVTSYSSIDRQPLDRDLYRKLAKGETTMLRELVDYAANVANRRLVPEGFDRSMWTDLAPSERFYVRMLDMEAKGNVKVADFQNFAKSFAYGDYTELMASTAANAAALAGASDLKGRMLEGEGFAASQLRQVLFAIWKTMEGGTPDPKKGVTILRTEYAADYWQRRQKLIAFASFVAAKTKQTRPDESTAAHELAEALKVDRV